MSDTISVRLDLGVAKLEFAGVHIEQPIGITLDLSREKLAEIILGGAPIRSAIQESAPAPVVAPVIEPAAAPEPVVADDTEASKRREVGKLTAFSYDDLREKLSSMTAAAAAKELGVSLGLIYDYRRRLGIVGWTTPRKKKASSAPTKKVTETKPTEAPERTEKRPDSWDRTGSSGGKLARFGDAYLRDKLATLTAAEAAVEFEVSEASVYQHRKRLGIGSAKATKATPVAIAEPRSFTEYSDVELREMLSSRPWSSIAFAHQISLSAVIAEGKRLGVSALEKSPEVSLASATFHGQPAAPREADVDA